MEPLPHELRAALKAARPGLSDATIDRIEVLLSKRMLCDPESEKDHVAQLDRERLEIIRREIPEYAEVARNYWARIADQTVSDDFPGRRMVVLRKNPGSRS